MRTGLIPSFQIGRSRLIDRKDLDELIEKLKRYDMRKRQEEAKKRAAKKKKTNTKKRIRKTQTIPPRLLVRTPKK
jgi:protein subunit release factor B